MKTLKKITHRHPFHIVDPSPWPIFSSLFAFSTAFGCALYFHGYEPGYRLISLGFIALIFAVSLWWRDVIREATFEGHHTLKVQHGLRWGIGLFIVSEAILFFAFFWAFFHSSLNPTPAIGCVWPPVGITPIRPYGIPLFNTFLLLLSGFTITWSHLALKAGGKKQSLIPLRITISIACFFLSLQVFEYYTASFSISDSVYGSTFYITTGLHGLHVLVGTIFLIVCILRLIHNHFARDQHLGFEFAIWYWHFVDVVWILVYLSIYAWGN
jgi:cytochrome c oxidase subunit 3